MNSHQPSIKQMIADIESDVKMTRNMIGKKQLDARVMDAMASIPRDVFVPDKLKQSAFMNGPLPIGYGQTISQPYIVALMTDMLAIGSDHRILEIGTGSGYQTAVLAHLCQSVYTMERISELSLQAQQKLNQLDYQNIEYAIGNGYEGWPEHAPYDGIIVTAAASHIPEELLDQLKPGGRMAIPIGPPLKHQELMLVTKDRQNVVKTRYILGVAFVPLREDDPIDHEINKRT